MSESTAEPPGRIFISYRREETAYPAGWLYDRLRDRYGDQVFKDVDSIQLGDDFVEAITRAVASCDVLLALIGDQWLTIANADGQRRLDDPDDFVRIEIEAALTRNVRVVPILVDRARMPRAEELPASLAGLVRRQALELSPSRFDFDTGRLLGVLDSTLAEARAISGHREPPDDPRRHLSGRAWALAGVGVGVVLIVLAVVAVVPRLGKAAPGTPPPTTESQPAAAILSEDFASQRNGWGIVSDWHASGAYTDGAYRISVPHAVDGAAAGAWSLPQEARSVYRSAPPNLRIDVRARRLPRSDRNMEYGVLCHLGALGDGYIFVISDNHAKIMRVGSAGYQIFTERDTPIDASAENRVQAECRNADGQPAVHLALSVNGQLIAEYTDARNPLLDGTVGLHVGTLDGARSAGVAEFDDFAVTRV